MPGEHPWGDRGQIVALVVFLAVWALDSFVFRGSTFLAKEVGLLVRLGVAALVMAPAVYFMHGGHRAASHEPEPSLGLITDGAFSRARHPLYLGSLLVFLAFAAATLSLVSLAVWIGVFIFYDVIASYEERELVRAYGPAYEAYRSKVPKWLPRIKKTAFR